MRNEKIPQLFKIKDSLGPLESEIMKVIWRNNKTDVREVTENLRKKKPIAYTTVMTIMGTLFKKGFLTRQKVGKAYQYSAVAPKTIFFKNALFSTIIDLIENYGRAWVILAALRFNTSFVKQLKIPTISVAKISRYKQVWFWRNKTPVGYGMTFTLIGIILAYSVWDLFQNLQFFGTTEYINLAFSEPTLVIERLNLIALAIIESLPMLNLSATIVFFILFVLVGKKLNKITDRNIFPRLGGLA